MISSIVSAVLRLRDEPRITVNGSGQIEAISIGGDPIDAHQYDALRLAGVAVAALCPYQRYLIALAEARSELAPVAYDWARCELSPASFALALDELGFDEIAIREALRSVSERPRPVPAPYGGSLCFAPDSVCAPPFAGVDPYTAHVQAAIAAQGA